MTQSVDLSKLSDTLPTDTTKQYGWKPGTGWVEATASGSSITKANFKAKVLSGALGWNGTSQLWHDSTLGTVMRLSSYAGGPQLQGSVVGPSVFQYWTATGVAPSNYIYDGITSVSVNGTAATVAKLSASDTTLVFNTGSTAASTFILANRPDPTPSLSHTSTGIATAKAWMTVRIPTVATSAQDMSFQITLSVGYSNVVIRHRFSVNSNRVVIDYTDNLGTGQSVSTTFTPVAATIYEFWAALDATNMTVGYTDGSGTTVTLATIARTALQANQSFIGPQLLVQKTVGTTALTFHVRDFGMEIALA